LASPETVSPAFHRAQLGRMTLAVSPLDLNSSFGRHLS
jgi:hypothetical protein